MSSSNRIKDTLKATTAITTTASIRSNSSSTSVANIDDSIGGRQKFRNRKSSNSRLECVISTRPTRATSANSKRSSLPLLNNTVSDKKTFSNDIGNKKMKTRIQLTSTPSPTNGDEIFANEFLEDSDSSFSISAFKEAVPKKSDAVEADRNSIHMCETQKIDDDKDGVQADDDDDDDTIDTIILTESDDESNHSDVCAADIATKTTATAAVDCDKIETMQQQNAISKSSQPPGSDNVCYNIAQQDLIWILQQVQAGNNACSSAPPNQESASQTAFASIHEHSRKLIFLALDNYDYHPIYFEHSNSSELKRKILSVLSLSVAFRQKVASNSFVAHAVGSSGLFSGAQSPSSPIYECLYFCGPRGIPVRITDELVRYEFAHNSCYFADIMLLSSSAGLSSETEKAAWNQFKIVLIRCNDH